MFGRPARAVVFDLYSLHTRPFARITRSGVKHHATLLVTTLAETAQPEMRWRPFLWRASWARRGVRAMEGGPGALVRSRARVSVEDDGAGIAPNERDRVFAPFYREPRGRDRRCVGLDRVAIAPRSGPRLVASRSGDLALTAPTSPIRLLAHRVAPGCAWHS